MLEKPSVPSHTIALVHLGGKKREFTERGEG